MKKLCLLFAMTMAAICVNAQDMTQLVSEFKSDARAKNIQSLNESREKLKDSGIQSLDKMVENTDGILKSVSATSDTIPPVYTRVMGETMEGAVNANVKKPSVSELESLASQISNNALKIAEATNDLDAIQNDVSNIKNPLQVKKAMNSVSYTKSALKLSKDEVNLQYRIVDALLKQLK